MATAGVLAGRPRWRHDLALGLALVAVVGLVRAQAATTVPVRIENFAFAPADRTVHVGDTVTWANDDDSPHRVVFSDGTFRSKALDTSEDASFTFDKPGAVPYFCGLHPQMKGTITVVP